MRCFGDDNRTCKHGDLVNIVELSEIFAIEAGPKVRDQDLGSLVQAHPFAVKDCLIAETVETLRDQVHKACGGEVGAINAVCKAASKFLIIYIRHCKGSKKERKKENIRYTEHHQPRASTALAPGREESPHLLQTGRHVEGLPLYILTRSPRSREW